MAYKEKDIVKKYYSISEVAKMFKVATSLIRFWESEFETIQPRKNSKGNRQYTQEDIDNIKQVFVLVKEKGFTLQGAKDLLKQEALNPTPKIVEQKENPKDKQEALKSLAKVRDFLITLQGLLPD